MDRGVPHGALLQPDLLKHIQTIHMLEVNILLWHMYCEAFISVVYDVTHDFYYCKTKYIGFCLGTCVHIKKTLCLLLGPLSSGSAYTFHPFFLLASNQAVLVGSSL